MVETKPKPSAKSTDEIIITVTKKKAKSFTTDIKGLDKFEINEKNFAKTLGKKFSTGASHSKGEGIIMQGDWADEMTELIIESFPDQVKLDDIKIVKK